MNTMNTEQRAARLGGILGALERLTDVALASEDWYAATNLEAMRALTREAKALAKEIELAEMRATA